MSLNVTCQCIPRLPLPSFFGDRSSARHTTQHHHSQPTFALFPLRNAGFGAELLIHEATFEGCLHAHATRKKHSTVEEAIGAAVSMQSYRVILTHFSQRYRGRPAFAPDTVGADRAAVAFDGLRVNLADLDGLPRAANVDIRTT